MSQVTLNDAALSKRWRLLQMLLLLIAAATVLVPASNIHLAPLHRHWGWDLLLYLPLTLSVTLVLVILAGLFSGTQGF